MASDRGTSAECERALVDLCAAVRARILAADPTTLRWLAMMLRRWAREVGP